MDPLEHFKSAPLLEKFSAYILVKYRWLFVFIFLLPLSFFYNILFYIRNKIIFHLNSAPKQHDNRVKRIQQQVRQWKESGSKVPMCTSRPGWQAMSFRIGKYKSSFYKVDVNLIDILELNTKRGIVRVEPQVSMGQISALLLPLGWTIPIVPELDDLTVGGLLMGTGIETSSHIYGLFQHICVAMEIVISDGTLMRCSPTENSDLFYAAFWSYGTLGFLVAAELKIIPIKPYVKVTYYPCHSRTKFIERFQQETMKTCQNEFTEGIAFSKNSGVVMTANMTNEIEDGKVNEIGRFYKPWFYKHVEEILKKDGSIYSEYIPLRHYFHRHSKSIFWELEDIMPFGNAAVFRYFFGFLIPPKISLLKLTQGKTVKKMYELSQMIQDMLLPLRYLNKALDQFDEEANIYPLWLCPFKLFSHPGMLQPVFASTSDQEEVKLFQDEGKDGYVMYVDIGAYGVPKNPNYQARESTRRIEAFVRQVGGYQMLYADTYMTRQEFRAMFHHELYDKMRQQLNCEGAFPEVYDKVSKDARI